MGVIGGRMGAIGGRMGAIGAIPRPSGAVRAIPGPMAPGDVFTGQGCILSFSSRIYTNELSLLLYSRISFWNYKNEVTYNIMILL